MKIYFESRKGCGVREARTVESGRKAILREAGEYDGVQVCREATEADIAWVKGMGGYIPD
jgi:hypothetical protein